MEIQRHALVKRDYLVPFVLVTSLFFLWGFAHAILDVLNKHFQEVMDITRTHSAMVQVTPILRRLIGALNHRLEDTVDKIEGDKNADTRPQK